MNDIYGPSTRAASRNVANVITFETPTALTRSGEEPSLRAYIVNFEEGGFSVLGAHASIPSVLCITDAGQFTEAEVESISQRLGISSGPSTRAEDEDVWMSYPDIHDFGHTGGNPDPYNVNDYNTDWDPGETQTSDTGDYLIGSSDDSFIKEDLLITTLGAPNNNLPYRPNWDENGEGGSNSSTTYGPWTNGEFGSALLSTRWDQGAPFNNKCPYDPLHIREDRASVGCVPLALVQIFAYNGIPTLSTFDVTQSTWAQLRNADYPDDCEATDQCSKDIAQIMFATGLMCHTWYNVPFSGGQSFSTPAAAKRYLKIVPGYSDVKKHNDIKLDKLKSMVDDDCPVFVAGHNSWSYTNSHAWVIDGYVEQSRTKTTTGSNGSTTSTESRTLVHCNFGWGGVADGYYAFKVFDTSNGAIGYDPSDPFQGSTVDWHVEAHYRMISYSK
jgi:hypothetical protein